MDSYEVKHLHQNIPEKNLGLSTRQVIIFCKNLNPKANDTLTGLALTQAAVQGSGAT